MSYLYKIYNHGQGKYLYYHWIQNTWDHQKSHHKEKNHDSLYMIIKFKKYELVLFPYIVSICFIVGFSYLIYLCLLLESRNVLECTKDMVLVYI